MPRYLLKVNYTADGVRGLLKEGGSARRDAAARLIESVGGTMEAFYYAFGDTDLYVIADLPDHEAAAATSLQVSASGAIGASMTVLLTAEQVDAASSRTTDYRPPGA